MIERVAQAMQRASRPDALVNSYAIFLARVAIEAMREPTEAMWEAGKHRCHGVDLNDGSRRVCGGYLGETSAEQWRRMIDAALS